MYTTADVMLITELDTSSYKRGAEAEAGRQYKLAFGTCGKTPAKPANSQLVFDGKSEIRRCSDRSWSSLIQVSLRLFRRLQSQWIKPL